MSQSRFKRGVYADILPYVRKGSQDSDEVFFAPEALKIDKLGTHGGAGIGFLGGNILTDMLPKCNQKWY